MADFSIKFPEGPRVIDLAHPKFRLPESVAGAGVGLDQPLL